MSKLTVAQKHDLIVKFNEDRDQVYDEYLSDKVAKKTAGEEVKKQSNTYNKLYKHLGPAKKDKDVRRQLQEEVDMYTDNQLSTSLHANHIPGYTMNKHNQVSDFKATFKGKVEEPVDKIYFRQKDEINQYAESFEKCKHILSRGKATGPPGGEKK